MKIVKLKGGLGNQMFQYAFARLLEKRTNEAVKLDYTSYTSLKNDTVRVPRIAKFSLSLDPATGSDLDSVCKFKHRGNSQSFFYRLGIYAEKTLNKKYFWEPTRAFIDPDVLTSCDYFDGYWQSYKYVDEVKDVLRFDFAPKDQLSEKTAAIQKIMQSQNSVFVGVRRGDYTAEAAHYGQFSSEYYRKAMDLIAEKTENPVFYIFSNDIAWCKENLDFGVHSVLYREPEDQTDDFEELMLMASCKHAIIVNSTYNWWGAYLIDNPKKIVCCPEKWFFDDAPIEIIPEEFTKIPCI